MLLAEAWDAVRAQDARAGRNVMLYLDDRPAVEVGAELIGPLTPIGAITISELPGGATATTTVHGQPNPAAIGDAHAGTVAWCRDHGHPRTGVRWEIYSHHSPDPSQMHTEVHHQLVP